jgi:hypothetical protein
MLKTMTILALLGIAAALPAPAQTASPHSAARNTAPARTGRAGDQFTSEQAAKAHCPGDAIVWANLGSSKAYHASGDRYYGKTRHGAYMCQKEADQAGFHAAGHRATKTAVKATTTKPTR